MITGLFNTIKKYFADNKSKFSPLYSKITVLFIVGLAVSIIVSALCRFELGDRIASIIVSDSLCPTLEAKTLFDYIWSILKYSRSDIILVAVVAVSGISFIGNTAYLLLSLFSGYILGYGVISTLTKVDTLADDKTAVAVTISLIFFSALRIITPVFLSILSTDSRKLAKLFKSGDTNWLFSKVFFHYLTNVLIFLGSSLLLRICLALLLKLITVV